jgi:hypothetical protein
MNVVDGDHEWPSGTTQENDKDLSEGWRSNWPLGFCECHRYNSKGKLMCIPYFIPMSVCSTCCLLGLIRTSITREQPVCLGMGKQGLALCVLSAPIKMMEPLGGFCWFALISSLMRQQVVDAYNIDDQSSCNCLCFEAPIEISPFFTCKYISF